MADSGRSSKARAKPSDGRVVMFTRVDPGLPELFSESCNLLSVLMGPDERQPPTESRQVKQLYAFREIIYWAAENYPDAFVSMLSKPMWERPEDVRAELSAMGLSGFAEAVYVGSASTDQHQDKQR